MSEQKQKEEEIVLEGVILEATRGNFRVQINDSHVVLARLAGKLRHRFIRIVQGDKVKVAVSPYDLTKGRIIYREKN